MERRKLSDILRGGDRERLEKTWEETKAAKEFGHLPAGTYVARIVAGEATTSRKGTPGYKLTFRVLEGDHSGRLFWHEIWLTEAAMPMAKRDFAKLGVLDLSQLENPLPPGIRCQVKLAVRKDDNGNEQNRVRSFEVLGVDAPDMDPFAPQAGGEATA